MKTRTAAIAAFVAAIALAWPYATSAEEQEPMNAFAFWQGQGQIVDIGDQRVALIGAFGGPFYVETSEGPVETGMITCPALMQIDLRTARQAGSGSCMFTAHDGARAYGDWECTGVHLVGCKGIFTIRGGSGRLAGITGSSTIVFRGRPERLTDRAGMVSTDALGIAVWRDFKLTTAAPAPAKP
jgi:hypothetical protein